MLLNGPFDAKFKTAPIPTISLFFPIQVVLYGENEWRTSKLILPVQVEICLSMSCPKVVMSKKLSTFLTYQNFNPNSNIFESGLIVSNSVRSIEIHNNLPLNFSSKLERRYWTGLDRQDKGGQAKTGKLFCLSKRVSTL